MICENLEKTLSHIFGKYSIEDGLNIYIQSLMSKSKKLKKQRVGILFIYHITKQQATWFRRNVE